MDNAATSWPKPPEVLDAMVAFLRRAGGNPGRSGHRLSVAAARVVAEARDVLAEFFNAPDPLRIVLTANATHAINLVLSGFLRPGDRVVTTAMEHNAVMRPLRALERTRRIEPVVVPCRKDGTVSVDGFSQALGPGARLAVVNHASNVAGTLQPLETLAAAAHRAGALVLVDAAQSAGVEPLDVTGMDIDFLAFAGHKGLYGPPGTGGLILGPRVDPVAMEPVICGGTGSRSDSEAQPPDLPDRFESGTLNGAGVAGLLAGVRFVQAVGRETIRAHDRRLRRQLVEGLRTIAGVTLHGPEAGDARCNDDPVDNPAGPSAATAVLSFTVAGRRVSEIGQRLDEQYGVLSRVGLHCAPAAHRSLGTFPEGTVRLAPGWFTTALDIERVIHAVQQVVRHG